MSVCVGPVPSEHQFRGGRQLSLERHVALCVSALCAQPFSAMADLALFRELRFRGFPYGTDSLLNVCSWATSIGHSCLDDFQKDVRLDSLAGASAVAPNVLRYIEDVLKAYSCVSWLCVAASLLVIGTPCWSG